MNDEIELKYYSAALDEIYRLRRALAFEARVAEAHYEGLKSYPKSRRGYAEEQVARMREAAAGNADVQYRDMPHIDVYGQEAIPNGLSRGQWEALVDGVSAVKETNR